jgi:hypothetical protein
MVTVMPTRASVNANLYTDIPTWNGKNSWAYIESLERERREINGDSPCLRATQRVEGEREVVVKLRNRRRSDSW